MDAAFFTTAASPFILAIVLVNTLFDAEKTKRIWTVLGMIGGGLFFIGGWLYNDRAIVVMETVFFMLNLYGHLSTYQWFQAFMASWRTKDAKA
jgi:hypothetical protein